MVEAASTPRKDNATIVMPAEILDKIAFYVPHKIYIVTNEVVTHAGKQTIFQIVGAFDTLETANAAARKYHVFTVKDKVRAAIEYAKEYSRKSRWVQSR